MNRVLIFIILLLIIWFFIPIYRKPRIIKNVLSDEECEHIKQFATKRLQTSTV